VPVSLKNPIAHKAVGFFTLKGNIAMTTVTIDHKDYKLDTLSDDAKAQLQSLQFCDAELQRLSAQTAVLQTARIAYANALKLALPALADDTMKLN
jgi:hypothetical protein